MKNLVIGLLFIGLTNLLNAQNLVSSVNKSISFKSNKTTTPSVFENNHSGFTKPTYIRNLEKKAAALKPKVVQGFDGRSELFEVEFLATNGKLVVLYDKKGEIYSYTEKFANVNLHSVLVKILVSQYPGWKIKRNSYTSSYNKDSNILKSYYTIYLIKEDEKIKTLIDSEGNIL